MHKSRVFRTFMGQNTRKSPKQMNKNHTLTYFPGGGNCCNGKHTVHCEHVEHQRKKCVARRHIVFRSTFVVHERAQKWCHRNSVRAEERGHNELRADQITMLREPHGVVDIVTRGDFHLEFVVKRQHNEPEKIIVMKKVWLRLGKKTKNVPVGRDTSTAQFIEEQVMSNFAKLVGNTFVLR